MPYSLRKPDTVQIRLVATPGPCQDFLLSVLTRFSCVVLGIVRWRRKVLLWEMHFDWVVEKG